MDTVSDFYVGQKVFVTGATGFMGKVLVEKLLRSFQDIGAIYILIRPKNGKTAQDRITDYYDSPVFNELNKHDPIQMDKLKLVCGDMRKEDLGLDEADIKKIMNCSIIFHCAACVRFDQNIKDAVEMNTLGTYRLLQLAKQSNNLKAFVHVSTAYCNCNQPVLEEKVYSTPYSPEHIMKMAEWMPAHLMESIKAELIYPQPNSYAFSKSLSEALVSQYSKYFPIGIARPSIVTAAWEEPIPGWVDNMNGPTGLIVAAGKGVIRSMLCNSSYMADVMPVDFVINGCILIARDVAMSCSTSARVYNITESGRNAITWKEALDMGRKHVEEFPFENMLWYPDGSPKTSKITHYFAHVFFHLAPAYFIDFLMWVMKKEIFMVRVQKRVSGGLKVLQYYTTKEWNFINVNFACLADNLNDDDRNKFYIDTRRIDWNSYMRNYIRGARQYCCKESPATLPQSRRRFKSLFYIDRILKWGLLTILLLYTLLKFLP